MAGFFCTLRSLRSSRRRPRTHRQSVCGLDDHLCRQRSRGGNPLFVNSPYPIDKKFEAFNFHVINIDGNDFDQIEAAFKEARKTKGMPTAIIAKTIKGKGVSFMEDQAGWHGKAPNDEQYAQAMEELEKAGEALCQK